ncbi:hypothetical protein JOD16_001334 [Enterococcus xiangfangensis]|nr:hypothetical protein [Enterococcus xiangfangensis]
MSIQLNMILLATRLLNVKKVFTLSGDSLKKKQQSGKQKLLFLKIRSLRDLKRLLLKLKGQLTICSVKVPKKF